MHKKKGSWLLIAVTLLFVVFIVAVLPKVSSYTSETIGVSETPDTKFFYTSDDLYRIAEECGEEGRAIYVKLRWTFDLLWPIVYTAFLFVWIWQLSTYLMIRKYYYIPILAMAFDYLENLATTIVFINYPKEVNSIASITPWLSILKWTILGFSFLIWFVLLAVAAYRVLRPLNKNKT